LLPAAGKHRRCAVRGRPLLHPRDADNRPDAGQLFLVWSSIGVFNRNALSANNICICNRNSRTQKRNLTGVARRRRAGSSFVALFFRVSFVCSFVCFACVSRELFSSHFRVSWTGHPLHSLARTSPGNDMHMSSAMPPKTRVCFDGFGYTPSMPIWIRHRWRISSPE